MSSICNKAARVANARNLSSIRGVRTHTTRILQQQWRNQSTVAAETKNILFPNFADLKFATKHNKHNNPPAAINVLSPDQQPNLNEKDSSNELDRMTSDVPPVRRLPVYRPKDDNAPKRPIFDIRAPSQGVVYRWLRKPEANSSNNNVSSPAAKEFATKAVEIAAAATEEEYFQPIDLQNQQSHHFMQRSDPLSAGFKRLEKTEKKQVFSHIKTTIPRLQHGLEKVLTSPGLHLLKDLSTEKYNFHPFLAKIHQPNEIDYNALPPFVTTSKDEVLHSLALKHKCTIKGSTSSVSSLLTHLYFLFSNFKSTSTECLLHFHDQNNNFTTSLRKPTSVILRPKGNTFSIDADKGFYSPRNQILLDLGKSMEKMLTMKRADFESTYLQVNKSKAGGKKVIEHPPEAYSYLKVGDLMLRSQLDCYSPHTPGENKVFDLKTRATTSIRMNCERWFQHTEYRLDRVTGTLTSFEKEYYDMIRSVFIKYSIQGRIGNMGGMFVTYHNTVDIFGFEYISLDEIDRSVFGSKAMANVSFDSSLKLLNEIIKEIFLAPNSKFGRDKSLRLTFDAVKDFSVHMNIYVEPLEDDKGWIDDPADFSEDTVDPTNPFRIKTEVHSYRLDLRTFINKQLMTEPFDINSDTINDDDVEIYFQLSDRGTTAQNPALFQEYVGVLQRNFMPETTKRI